MKKVLISLVYLSLLLVFSASACKKQKLPSGDHSFYCYIDGELFVPKGDPNFTTSPYDDDGYTFYKWEHNTTVYARDYEKYVVFFNTLSRSLGKHYLEESSGSLLDYSINHAIVVKNGTKYISKEGSGYIQYNESNDENVKGTFEFTLYNEDDDSDVIHVTGGHFDD